MSKYSKREIMAQAWRYFKTFRKYVEQYWISFSEALKRAWKEAKEKVAEEIENARTGRRVMKYFEYKRDYADCQTVEGSYDKRNKTIVVLTKVSRYPKIERKENQFNQYGVCKYCGTWCYGDCRA